MAKKKKPAEDGEGEAKKGKDPKLMAAGGLLVAAAVYWFVLKPAPVDEGAEGLGQPVIVEPIEGEILELPEMVLNINDDSVTYLRIGVALVLEEGTVAKTFEAEAAIAKDILLHDLTQLSAADLEDPIRREEVKQSLSHDIRAAYGDAKVVRVLFTSMVMQ